MKISDKEKIEIMQHFIDGGEIEQNDLVSTEYWYQTRHPRWNWSKSDYRIKKPESETVYEVYRIEKKTGECNILDTLYTDSDLYKTRLQYETHYTFHKTGRSFEIKLGDK